MYDAHSEDYVFSNRLCKRVIRSLNDIIEWRGKPKTIRVNNDEGDRGSSGTV